MDHEEIKPLLVKYITGEAGEPEVREVKDWINQHPENELYFVELYEAWQNMLYLKPEVVDEEKAYEAFVSRTRPANVRYLGLAKWAKIAAAIAIFFVLAYPFVKYFSSQGDDSLAIVAQKGKVKKIILSDGTIVWLNAGSTLKYGADFGKKTRTVNLDGEAFFEIAPGKKGIPFLVKTKNYVIRDIGTKFNLKAYANDPYFETAVVKGEVSVEVASDNNMHNVNNRIYIKPQQVLKIYYHPSAPEAGDKPGIDQMTKTNFNEIQVTQVDSAKLNVYDGWKEDLLIFDGKTLDEIARVLERRYDVRIAMDDASLQAIRYSGRFKNIASINKVLDIIKENTPINYSVTGSTITITKNN